MFCFSFWGISVQHITIIPIQALIKYLRAETYQIPEQAISYAMKDKTSVPLKQFPEAKVYSITETFVV